MRALAAVGCASALAFLWLVPIAGAYTGGQQIDYVQGGLASITSTSSTSQTTILTGDAETYDGSTRVEIEFYSPQFEPGGTSGWVQVDLWDGGTDVGQLMFVRVSGSSSASSGTAFDFVTPTAGSHIYSVRAFETGGTASVGCALSVCAPTFLRIVDAEDPSSGGSSTLAGLSDVNLGTPADSDVLQYNGSTSKWVSASPSVDTTLEEGFATSHSDSDVIVGAICALPVAFALLAVLRGRRS